jgi:hypothetical protein
MDNSVFNITLHGAVTDKPFVAKLVNYDGVFLQIVAKLHDGM